MTKVAINGCYGGFGLSDEAFILLMAKKGVTIYAGPDNSLSTEFWTTPRDQLPAILKKEWYNLKDEERQLYEEESKKHGRHYQHDYIERKKRADPDLIAVIEELGPKRASGPFGEVKVVEIPDNVSWEIQEYDGIEWVAEKHRTWS